VFLSRVNMPERDIATANLCVRLSHADIVSKSMHVGIVKLFIPSGKGVSLVFFDRYRRYKIPRGIPSAGSYIQRGGENLRFWTEIAINLRNDMTNPWLLCTSLIGSHRLPNDPCRFQ